MHTLAFRMPGLQGWYGNDRLSEITLSIFFVHSNVLNPYFVRIRDGGGTLADVLADYQSCNPDLNVLAFVTQFIPMEVSL